MRRIRFALSLVVLSSLAACTVEGERLPDVYPVKAIDAPAPSASPSEATAEIAPAQAQAEAAVAQVGFGLDATLLGQLSTGRLLAEDFDGAPYMYLVFTSEDEAIRAPLSFQVPETTSEGDTTTSIGATPDRPRTGLVASDLSVLASIQRAVAALGGEPNLRRIVAASPSSFLLEDVNGGYWDVTTAERIPDEMVAEQRAAIADKMRSPEAMEEAAQLRGDWYMRFDEAPNDALSIASLTREDGNLDLARSFAEAKLGDITAQMRPIELTPAEVEAEPDLGSLLVEKGKDQCHKWWFFGWRETCYAVELGRISNDKKQAHVPKQNLWYTLPRCVIGGSVPNVYEGCGPAAMTALVWRAWEDGIDFPALSGFDRTGATKPSDAYPYRRGAAKTNQNRFDFVLGTAFGRLMGTCTPGKQQGLTLPAKFHSGANAWLKSQGVPLRLAHATSVPPFHGADAKRKAKLLHQFVGVEERPVIALGDVGFASAHYAPVRQYRIVNPRGASPEVWVKMLGWSDMWINLHGAFQLTSALYWFEET